MRKITFEPTAFQHFSQWAIDDKKLYQRIVTLLKEIMRQPFSGTGKPEPLKHELQGCWSRRINDEHRLVYKVTDEAVIVISCKYHYQ